MEDLKALDYDHYPPQPSKPDIADASFSDIDADSSVQRSIAQNELDAKDALTGLYGQSYLCRAIDECLHRSRNGKLTATLALLQLENFYEIRNWVGLIEADQLLGEIADILKSALPKHALLCRCHNFEFAVLLLGRMSNNATLVTEQFKQALFSAVSPSLPRQLELKCGIGLAKLDSNIPSWPVVFARARHNLRLVHQQESPAIDASDSEVALRQLHKSLERSELELNFQAWAHLSEHSDEHYEVRCSLASSETGVANFSLFEAAAGNALGETIDRRIVDQVKRLSRSNKETRRFIINLSHNSIVSKSFLCWLQEILKEETKFAHRLVFQISETDALIAQHHLVAFSRAIKNLGCGISLSNFGCTPQPFRYLSLVPANYAKLDLELINKIDINEDKLVELIGLVTDLHARQIKAVAPMLEQLTLLPSLWQAGIDYFQGNCLHTTSEVMNYEFLRSHTLGQE